MYRSVLYQPTAWPIPPRTFPSKPESSHKRSKAYIFLTCLFLIILRIYWGNLEHTTLQLVEPDSDRMLEQVHEPFIEQTFDLIQEDFLHTQNHDVAK